MGTARLQGLHPVEVCPCLHRGAAWDVVDAPALVGTLQQLKWQRRYDNQYEFVLIFKKTIHVTFICLLKHFIHLKESFNQTKLNDKDTKCRIHVYLYYLI